MEAIRFLAERLRLCRSMKVSCEGCPIHGYCGVPVAETNLESIAREAEIVEKWAAEHPRKTRLQDFLEKYPAAAVREDGFPPFMPAWLGYCGKSRYSCEHQPTDQNCWDLPAEDE